MSLQQAIAEFRGQLCGTMIEIDAVGMAKINGVRVSIRGRGHNAAGLGVCDDGLVIDLALINYVRVDPYSRTVLVGAGSKWADVDHAAHLFGLAVPSGVIPSTGVAGPTLGGGMGHLTRKYALTIDKLLSVDKELPQVWGVN